MVGAGAVVLWRADGLAVMSSRYDSPAGDARRDAAEQAAAGRVPDSASIWEALSRGDDPTAVSRESTPD
jgi:hypothetical protein